jgi:hypothetical protein
MLFGIIYKVPSQKENIYPPIRVKASKELDGTIAQAS